MGRTSDIRKSISKAKLDVTLPENLVNKIANDVKKSKYVTPFTLSEKYEIKISTAKKILKILEMRGILKLYSSGSRTPIYVPV